MSSFTVSINCPCLQATLRDLSVTTKTAVRLEKLHPSHTHTSTPSPLPTHSHLLPQLLQLSVFSCQSGQHVCILASCISWPPHRPRGGTWPKTEESEGWCRSLRRQRHTNVHKHYTDHLTYFDVYNRQSKILILHPIHMQKDTHTQIYFTFLIR